MSEERGVAKGLFIGFLGGAIVGGIVALLYAPKSGAELRGDIRKKRDELLDDADEYLDIAKHKAQDIVNEGKKRSEELITEAKKKAGTLLGDANRILNVAKDKTSSTYETSKEKIVDETGKIKDAIKAGVEAYKDKRNEDTN